MTQRRLVYTNKTVSYEEWAVQVQAKYTELDLGTFDPSRHDGRHAYDFGYTPDSWSREVLDTVKRRHRMAMFKKFNPDRYN